MDRHQQVKQVLLVFVLEFVSLRLFCCLFEVELR